MKKLILILLLLAPLFGLSQTNFQIFYNDFVECYFDNSSQDSLCIYDSINGKNLLSLKIEDRYKKRLWYKIAIKESKNGWAKIENIMFVPGMDDSLNTVLLNHKTHWIKIENLKLDAQEVWGPDSLGRKYFSEPNTQSEIILKSAKHHHLSLIGTEGLWAKVSFIHNDKKYVAWIEKENQCAYPWTACP